VEEHDAGATLALFPTAHGCDHVSSRNNEPLVKCASMPQMDAPRELGRVTNNRITWIEGPEAGFTVSRTRGAVPVCCGM
jgi:hypothetical protein